MNKSNYEKNKYYEKELLYVRDKIGLNKYLLNYINSKKKISIKLIIAKIFVCSQLKIAQKYENELLKIISGRQ